MAHSAPGGFAASVAESPCHPRDAALGRHCREHNGAIPAGRSTAVTTLFRTQFTLNATMASVTNGIVRALCDDGWVG
ncbi:MAG: hypothetical protein DCC68_23995 [Planctomycetota bacterium]|nr:MAG: hypothetical protein DCC68_23995 [Planctomycetota bacterium]